MDLKELDIKPGYDSEEDDVLKDFYIPLLSQSISYNRLAGFFSSTALAVSAKGISAFVANGGHMKLIASVKLSKSDVEAIQSGIENQDKVIEETMLRELNFLEDEFIRDHVRALGWMVANKKLEIKVAIIIDDNGSLLDEENIDKRGIFHQKVGIFEDKDGNSVSFSGSINESAIAWTQNIEEFNVFRSWIEGEREHLKGNYHKFEKYWRGAAKHVKVVDIPFAVREKLIQIAPTNFEELQLNRKKREFKKEIKLRDYQNDAIEAWFKNGCCGIFQMATGSGKTVTALASMKRLQTEKGDMVVVIACPYQHLVDQWRDVMVNDFGITPILAYDSRTGWEPKINIALQELNLKIRDGFYIITTYKTLSTDNFQSKLKSIKTNLLFIADEAHHLGSEIARERLPDAQFRLGLSATPDRWRDPEGTNLIKEYFGGVVYTFELRDAIEHNFLNEYLYMPIIIELNNAEINEYIEITKKIGKIWYKYKDEEAREKALNNLYRERATILNTASAKIGALEGLIEKEKPLSFTLIYCHDKNQLDKVAKLLFNKGIMVARITYEETPEEREQVIRDFKAGRINVLVAINCLDEGVDIPATRLAFILASSGNPRQFIQRRGRLLRILKDQSGKTMKKEVKIYDLITSPPFEHEYDGEKNDIEQKILSRELHRFKEFCGSAKNEFQARKELRNLLDKFGIGII